MSSGGQRKLHNSLDEKILHVNIDRGSGKGREGGGGLSALHLKLTQ